MRRQIMLVLATMMACATAQASGFRVEADPATDFNNITTYRIDRISIIRSGGDVSAANLDSVRETVSDYLQREGLRESKEAPDVRVTITAGVEVGLQNRELQGMPYYEGNEWHILPRDEKETDPVTAPITERFGEGSLQIDIRNKDNRVVWRANMRDVVNVPVSHDDLVRALDQVFAHCPPILK